MSRYTEDGVRHASFEEILEECGSLVWKTEGGSMEPLISTGDLVLVEKPTGSVKRGDVVLYKRGDRYVLHRVLRLREGLFEIVGDNTFTIELVPETEILGVMRGLTHRGKEVDLDAWRYRIYARLWGGNLPLRNVVSHLPRGLRRLLRTFRKLL